MLANRLTNMWNRFFFGLGDPTTCDLLRIGFSILGLINLGFLALDGTLWFGEHGLLPYVASRTVVEFSTQWTLFALLPKRDWVVWLAIALLAFHLVALLLGWKSRLQAIAVFVWLVSFQNRNPLILDASDVLFRLLSFFLILMPLGNRWAIDSSSKTPTPRKLWALQLVRIQLTLVYFSSAIYKLQSDDWTSGHALYYVFQLAQYEHFPIPGFFLQSLLLQKLVTWAVILVELLLPFLLWIPRTRLVGVALGLVLHLAIFYGMFLFLFQFLMMLLVCSFLKGEEISFAIAYLREKSGRLIRQ
tara:strand:+ start:20040 stop:20945 length:906 start_codon:yes stop_codon:yes gene_type:complete